MQATAELPLLIFTLLAQMAVGIILAGQCVLAGNSQAPVRARVQKQTLFALGFMGVAAILSMTHLGTPLHAPFTIFHAGSSWLSREILMVLLTTAALAGMVYFQWRKPDSRIRQPLAIAACVLGLVLIFAMRKVYNSPFMPGWAGSSTFFMFLASALVLGALWQGCALGGASEEAGTPLMRAAFMAVAGFVLLAVFLPLALPDTFPGMNPLSRGASPESATELQSWHAFLTGLGILVFLGAVWQAMRKRAALPLLILALPLAIGGEAAGRFAFYMSYAKLGM